MPRWLVLTDDRSLKTRDKISLSRGLLILWGRPGGIRTEVGQEPNDEASRVLFVDAVIGTLLIEQGSVWSDR